MLRAKFLITLAMIGAIHQFYSDDDTDMAKMQIPAATCANHAFVSAEVNPANGLDTDAIGAQGRNCTDAEVRLSAISG